MSEQQLENERTEIINALIRLDYCFKKYDSKPIRSIHVSNKMKKTLEYIFQDLRSFNFKKEFNHVTKNNEMRFCDIKIEVEE